MGLIVDRRIHGWVGKQNFPKQLSHANQGGFNLKVCLNDGALACCFENSNFAQAGRLTKQ